jgi:hypothetical protein
MDLSFNRFLVLSIRQMTISAASAILKYVPLATVEAGKIPCFGGLCLC